MTPPTRLLFLAPFSFACLALTACSGGTGTPKAGPVPTLPASAATDNAGTPSTTGSAAAQPRSQQDRALAFAKCIREHGVQDFPDPQFDDQGNIALQQPPSDPGFPAAANACAKELGSANGAKPRDDAQIAASLEQARKFAACMRSHGIDYADPVADDNGMINRSPGTAVETTSTKFQSAERECNVAGPTGGTGNP